MKRILRKIFISLLVFNLLLGNVAYATPVLAAPDLPSAPDTPDAPDSPDSPDTPDEADEPDEPDAPEAPNNANPDEDSAPEDEPDEPDTPETNNSEPDEAPTTTQQENATDTSSQSESDGQIGDTKVETGDVTGSGTIANIGNENLSVVPEAGSGTGGVSIVNSENGADSQNGGSVAIEDTTNTNQTNVGNLNNGLTIDVVSGQNSASENVGDSKIETGEANATGSILNAINTNVAGVMLSEFNVDDNHNGDLVLDFAANCISGCESVEIVNEDNGSGSENTGELDIIDSEATFQENTADVLNTLTLSADSGNNNADNNTRGDSTIKTGDANVAGNVVNFLNNNLAGNVIYGVVNVFGDLVGDIVIPQEVLATMGIGGVSMQNSGNGTDSTNTAEVDQTTTDEFTQTNTAEIINNLDLAATTGANRTSDNTGGNNKITTGDADVDAQVINIANNNIIGGNWWLVIVNEAGKWVGKIFAPDGSVLADNFAVAPGSQVSTAPNGDITIGNTDNGSGSENTSSVATENTNVINQDNNARIVNNIDLSANTGGNSASRNTGGNNEIETGDANILLNLVNFVNNNIIGGNVLVTVVNVFGSWVGDIVAPGAQKPALAENNQETQQNSNAIGGSSENLPTSNNSSSSSSSISSNSTQAATNTNSNFAFAPKTTKLAFAGTGGGVVLGDSPEEYESDKLAAGISGQPNHIEASDRTIRLNLAWLAPIAILGIIVAFIKRKVTGSIL